MGLTVVGDTSRLARYVPAAISSYHLYELNALDLHGPAGLPNQLALLQPDDEVPESRLVPEGDFDVGSGASGIRITHDMVINQVGIAKGVGFSKFRATYEMHGYYFDEEKLLVLRGTRKPVANFVRVWQDRGQETLGKVRSFEVDFAKLRPYLGMIKGAWFKFKGDPTLQSSGMFGNGVDQSVEFKNAEALGPITSLTFRHTFHNGIEVPVMLTQRGTIVVQQMLPTTELELELVLDVLRFVRTAEALTVVDKRGKKTKAPAGDAGGSEPETENLESMTEGLESTLS